MLETNGWALEAVRPSVDDAQATPAHAYSIGVTALTGFQKFLSSAAPATANDVISVGRCSERWTDIPTGCELVVYSMGAAMRICPVTDKVATSWCPALEEFTTDNRRADAVPRPAGLFAI